MITVDFRKRKLESNKGNMDLFEFLSKVLRIKRMKRSSQNYLGLCPFHKDIHHRSFGVSVDYPHAWGCMLPDCAKGSSLVTLVSKHQEVSHTYAETIVEQYMGYIKSISEKTSGLLYYDEGEDFTLSEDLLVEYSCGYIRHKYLLKRGLTEEIIKRFNAGFDPYKRRAVIPIYQDGKLINFVGRAVDDNVEPKYLIYEDVDRETFMFGEHMLPEEVPYLVVYEGVLETLYSHQVGEERCLSLLGAYVTEKQVEKMLRYTDVIIDFLDNDDAGRAIGEKLAYLVRKNGGQYRKVRHLSGDKHKYKDLLDYRSPKIIKTMIKIARNNLIVS